MICGILFEQKCILRENIMQWKLIILRNGLCASKTIYSVLLIMTITDNYDNVWGSVVSILFPYFV